MNSLEFYQETLNVFNKCKVEYLIVGGYAVNSYGFMRSTGDMDLWISKNKSNLDKISKALITLKYPADTIQTGITELKENRNVSLKHGDFFKIELISFLSTSIAFDTAFKQRTVKSILGLKVGVLNFDDLCNIKIKSGRNKDLLDVKELKRIHGKEK